MQMRRVLGSLALTMGLLVPASGWTAGGVRIEGTYKLVKRVLPDGKELSAPDVLGMMTFTTKYRNFNVFWKNAEGQPVSISYVAEYELANGKYCEHPLFWVQNNLGEPGVKYDVPAAKSDCSSVKVQGKKVSFPIPGEPPSVTIEGDTIVATAEGQFVDHWTKVK